MAMKEAFTVGIVLAAKDMYSSAMKKAQRNLGILRKTSTKSADAFEKSMKRFQAITAVGATMSVVSGQISGKIQEMTTDAIDLSEAMGKIGTVVLQNIGDFKSHQAAMEAWRTKGLDISTRSLYSASELINDVAYNLMSSGLTADTAMALMESVSNTAIATIGDLDTTSALFGSIMNTFGRKWDMSALEKGERIMNVLSGAVKKFTMTGNILAAGMSYATAAAESMNVPFEDTIAILGMLNTRGIESTKAGTAFLGFIRELPDATKKMGITIADTSGKLLPMADILQNIEKRLKGMQEIERTVLLEKALGDEGSKLIKILMGTSGELRENISILKESGIAAQMVEERMGTLSAEVKMQEHRWQNLRIELGGKAAPVMLGFKKGVLELVDVLGEIPHAKAFAGTTLGLIGMAAEIGKTIGPALTMVGMLGMWRTQAALAATAQAALNKQMGIGAATAGTQATKMGIMGSKGGALVGVLGRVAAVGAAAFIGWEIGTILRDVLNLDEGVQNLLATLTGADIGENMDDEFTKANDVINKLRNNLEVTKKELMWFVNFRMAKGYESGETYEKIKKTIMTYGISEEMIEEVAATRRKDIKKSKSVISSIRIGGIVAPTEKPKIGGIYETGAKKPESATGGRVGKESYYKKPSGAVESAAGGGVGKESYYKKLSPPKIEPYQTGIKRVGKTGLALIHEGEEIKPKSMAGRGAGIVNRNKELMDETMRPFSQKIELYQTGIKRVGKTGLALIHEGEEIKPKSMAGRGAGIVNRNKELMDETMRPFSQKIELYQTGIKRVGKTGLALIHEGEEIKPKSMAGRGIGTVIHMGGVTINLKSTGSAPMDAYKIKRELEKLYKMEARRLP